MVNLLNIKYDDVILTSLFANIDCDINSLELIDNCVFNLGGREGGGAVGESTNTHNIIYLH